MMNVNSNKPLFYPYIVLVNKCSGTCNNINNPYAKLCVPGAVKDINIKLFNLVSRIIKHVIYRGTKLVHVNED